MLSRLVRSVSSASTRRFAMSKVPCLIESAKTLAWIQNEKKQYKQFIQNRVRNVGG